MEDGLCHPDAVMTGPDVRAALALMAWIGTVLVADATVFTQAPELTRQLVLGIATWAVLAVALRRETALVRTQTLLVVVMATLVEYTFSPLLQAYTYRIGTVPIFVPPGHGLVYLAALLLGRSALLRAHARLWAAATVLCGGAWALAGVLGLLGGGRHDVLGLFWFGCLLAFLRWGPNRMLYVGAFAVVSYLEIAGTVLGTWAWASSDPVLHTIGQGNPPSGSPGGYGWFDLYATLLAPQLLNSLRALRAASWRRPLVASASPPNGPSSPVRDVNLPPDSCTIGTKAAMSYNASSGSQAMSTAPSATSM
jgi:hypothetical protein